MSKFKIISLILLLAIGFSCSKNNQDGTRTVNVRLTDNPFNAEEVNVDIHSVQLRHDDDESGNDDGWHSINTHDTIYNLLNLQNDINVLLATGTYPFDHLQEIRLLLGNNNSIKIGGIVYPLKVPSGTSSGYKIKIDKDLFVGNNDILIDFDAALSIHEAGNGMFMLRPVLRLK